MSWADMDLLSICSLQVRDDLILDPASGIGKVLNLDDLELLLLLTGCNTVGPTYWLDLEMSSDAVRGQTVADKIKTEAPPAVCRPALPCVHQVNCHWPRWWPPSLQQADWCSPWPS